MGEIIAISGFVSIDDNFRHVLVATQDGRLHEIFFKPQSGIFRETIGCFDRIIDVSAFFTPDDDRRHAIVATADGRIHELFFHPDRGISHAVVDTFPSIKAIAAFYSPEDNFRHVIVATNDGSIIEVFFNPEFGISQAFLGSFEGIQDIAAFFTSDDNFRHVIVATADGNLHEIFFSPQAGISQSVIANLSGVRQIDAFFSTDDNFRHIIAVTQDDAIHEVFFHPEFGNGISPLGNFGEIAAVCAYFTPDDGNRHSIIGTKDGIVHELFFNPQTGQGQSDLMRFDPILPALEDISPTETNGTIGAGDCRAGLILSLAGDLSALYAVSLNAGVWKSEAGGQWAQLAGSPEKAYCIAIDPNDPSHLAVGERDGDASAINQNTSGVWESRDGGRNWFRSFDPLSLAGCNSQAIPAVAFSRNSTLFIATACGVGRKSIFDQDFDFSQSPTGIGLVTALVASETRVWARTRSTLLFSDDDGLNWTAIDIPSILDGIDITFDSSDRGDLFSLAAFDSAAYMTCGKDPTPPCGNMNRLLIFDASTLTFELQPRQFDSAGKPLIGCSGVGLGGRRFVRTFTLNGAELPDVIGQRRHLIYCGSQEIYQATGSNPDGTINSWTMPIGASGPGLTNQDPVHSDLWDFLLTQDGRTALLACDGGVYMKVLPSSKWFRVNDGLHTHHIHSMVVLPIDPAHHSRLAYATQDNSGWFRDTTPFFSSAPDWKTEGALGDANWVAGDAGSPDIMLIARHAQSAILTAFLRTPPNGANFIESQPFTLNNDLTFNGPLFFQVIQTLKGEPPFPLLDAVMLVNLPVNFLDANKNPFPVPGRLGQPNPLGGPVLIRNSQFAANPHMDSSKGQGWQIEDDNLPSGTRGFWVSGGHSNPVYYLYASTPAGLELFKRRDGRWDRLNVTGLLDGGEYGPAFVNPYNPDQLFVLTSSGIKNSTDGGDSFKNEDTLTALLTESEKFPLLGDFPGGNGSNVVHGTQANPMGTLSHMAFYRDNPLEIVAASPFLGVFYTNGDGRWRDITSLLPRPHTPVSSVGIDCEAIYVAMEGRSIVRITGYRNII